MKACRFVLLAAFASWLVSGCAPATQLTNAWVDPAYKGPPFRNVLVLGVSRNEGERRTFEDEFAAKLRAAGVKAAPGYTVLPENGNVAKEVLEGVLKRIGADGAIVARVLDVDRRTAYSPGYVTVIPSVGYARGFTASTGLPWRSRRRPPLTSTMWSWSRRSLWQTRDATLVWSATTQTTDPGELKKEIAGYADVIIGALRERGLIGASAQGKN
ncbi:MAG: hypothetical protein HC807_01815 [Gammaproteobacteria bacterium]|nr:hypothetical protein [Gammaproteobacteria bacterium]